jgi:hypothetical protein
VFHVSQLKRSPRDIQVTPSFPSDLVELQVSEHVLQVRWTSGDRPMEQGLIKWSHMASSLATWEDLEPLRQQFPRAPARGHAGTHTRGNVTS